MKDEVLGHLCPVVLELRSSSFCYNYDKQPSAEADKMGPGAKEPNENEVGDIHSQFQHSNIVII